MSVATAPGISGITPKQALLSPLRGSKLLAVKRDREPNKGKYELPGGFVDFGETAQEGAIREIKEELGITVRQTDLQLIGVYYNDYNPPEFLPLT